MMNRSKELYEKAKEVMPGGVNSPVRAIKPYPFFVAKAEGSKIRDIDGNEYIDYCMGYGPLILGHAHPKVREAIESQLRKGWLYGAPHEAEIELASKIIKYYNSIDMVRFVNSGTEATLSAIRLARAFTGREKIIKIEGGFHGSHDAVLVKAGSSAATLIAASKGIPLDFIKHTLQVPFNDIEKLVEVVEKNKDEIAALIMEPILGNIGLVLPKDDYLREVRIITKESGILLIFDEVITGFRVRMGGAQELFGIDADITTLGKVVGGGFPIGVLGGRREIMEMIAPSGEVYQAGTFNGNPISIHGGLATVEVLERERVHEELERKGERLRKGLRDVIKDLHLEERCSVTGIASMLKVFFSGNVPMNYEEVMRCDTATYLDFFHKMLRSGIFLPPSQLETDFISAAHSDEDIEKTIEAYDKNLRKLR
ncbi:MAG: glutamate-1-semialdehyde 2,1-aminomutase [Candidatus Methanospirareceae archaeon]